MAKIKNESDGGSPRLVQTAEGLILTNDKISLKGDFEGLIKRIGPSNLNGEMVVKAFRGRGEIPIFNKNMDENPWGVPLIIDATAGLGEDSFLLAAAGYRVHMYEYNPIIGALLEDALIRAGDNEVLRPVAERITLFKEDAIPALRNLGERKISQKLFGVLLDPMFPKRTKSGLIKKKFQLIQQVETPCENEDELFMAAMLANPEKIVVKRPSKGECLSGKNPSYTLPGSVIRYDCYVL